MRVNGGKCNSDKKKANEKETTLYYTRANLYIVNEQNNTIMTSIVSSESIQIKERPSVEETIQCAHVNDVNIVWQCVRIVFDYIQKHQ